MKPNLFSIATRELSQDGFFTWLLQWADASQKQNDPLLNAAATDFVRLLLGKQTDYQINKVEAWRQWEKIDVCAEVNDEYFILIEDKTNTGEHSEQLERYKQIARDHYKDKPHQLVFVYLKTGNESVSTIKKVVEQGFSIIDRKSVLSILNRHPVANDIFNDFKDYLNRIENLTNSCSQFSNVTSEWRAAEGFYLKLQELIDEWSEWEGVPTPSGHFLGFWYHWKGTKEIGEIYIQIENGFENGIRLVIKIGSWKPSTATLYELLDEIRPIAEAYNLKVRKPNRFRPGTTSTLAVIEDAFPVGEDGGLDLDGFLQTLKRLEKTVDEFCSQKETSVLESTTAEISS